MTLALFNAILSTVTIGALMAAALGWRHSLASENAYRPEWFFAWAKLLMTFGIACRLLLWDVVWGVLQYHDPEAAAAFYANIGRTNINILFSGVILFGAYCSLKARQLILLEDRGVNWHWTIAWAYPRHIIALRKRGGKGNGKQ